MTSIAVVGPSAFSKADRLVGLRDLTDAVALPQGVGRTGPQDVLPREWRGDVGVLWVADVPDAIVKPQEILLDVDVSPAAGGAIATVALTDIVDIQTGDLVRVGRCSRSAGASADMGDVAVFLSHIDSGGTKHRGPVLFAWDSAAGKQVFSGTSAVNALIPDATYPDWVALNVQNQTFSLGAVAIGFGGANDILFDAATAGGAAGAVTYSFVVEIVRIEEALRGVVQADLLRRNL